MLNKRIMRFVLLCMTFAGTALLAACKCACERETVPSPPPTSVTPSTQTTNSNAAASQASDSTAQWQSLFDGRTLTGWKPTDFAGKGDVRVKDGQIILESGFMTGITWTNDLPRINYEIALEAMRVEGSDFFCGLTFPVGQDPCSFIVGGWGGGVVGLSSLDGEDAANNETTQYINFKNGQWFKIRVRVMDKRIAAWIDEDQVVNVETTGRRISIRPEVEESRPLGVATWSTTGALRNIRLRRL